MNRHCPVCLGRTQPTAARNVAGHLDGCGRPCPMNGQPYDLTYIAPKRKERE